MPGAHMTCTEHAVVDVLFLNVASTDVLDDWCVVDGFAQILKMSGLGWMNVGVWDTAF